MPQLDVNAFLPIVFCLFLCFSCFFLGMYLILFLSYLNYNKIGLMWQHKQLLSTYLIYIYLNKVGSYTYAKDILSILQDKKLYSTRIA